MLETLVLLAKLTYELILIGVRLGVALFALTTIWRLVISK